MIRPSRNGSLSPTRASAGPRLDFAPKLKMPTALRREPAPAGRALPAVGPPRRGIAQAEQVQGKELSYNNLQRRQRRARARRRVPRRPPTVVIVKHANPCGVATRDTLLDAWSERSPATACRRSADRRDQPPLDARRPRRSRRSSPKSSSPRRRRGRQAIFAKKKNLRLLLTGELPDPRAAARPWRSLPAGCSSGSRQSARSRATS
jgi:phosphoribosylaminoimidazolecarboxamide formyltransferase/IMP cyclohydrolase